MASTLKDSKKDGARFSVYLRPCQLEWLDAQAEKMGVSRSKFIELKTFPKELQLLKDKKGAKKKNEQLCEKGKGKCSES